MDKIITMEQKIEQYKPIIKELVIRISNKEYDLIKTNGQNGRVNIEDLKRVIDDYGCTIVSLPDKAFSIVEAYNITSENRIDIYLPLWTKEEGRSDLTLSLSCYNDNGVPKIEINDIRVL